MTTDHTDPPDGKLIDCAGDGSARGIAHGEELRELIGDALDRWRTRIHESTALAPDRYVEHFLENTGFIATLARSSPDLYDEIVGIATGSHQPLADVLVYNMMDEQWRFVPDSAAACSVLGTRTAAGPVLLAQNFDLPGSILPTSHVVLRIAAHKGQPEQLVLTGAGIIGFLGVNAAGLACCVNTLKSLPCQRDGMPVAGIVREVLRLDNAEAAGKYLMSVSHASGQHYAIGDPAGVRGYECSAAGCVPGPVADAVLHTNHSLWSPTDLIIAGFDPGTSHERLHALHAGLDEVRASGSVADVLSSQPSGLCITPTPQRDAATFYGAEFTLTRPPRVRVTMGRPDRTPWVSPGWTDAECTAT